MARAWKLLLKLIVGTILAFHVVASSSAANIAPGCQKEKNETMDFKKKWDACQTQKLDDLLDRFDNEQYCSPCDEVALRTQLADMRDQLRDSEAQVVEINATLEANRTELTVTKTKLANLNFTLEANRAKLAQTEEKLAVTEANLTKTEEKLVKREAELLDTQTTLANMTATLLKAQAQLRQIKSELATRRTQNDRELRQTQNQLAESTGRTNRAQVELAQAKTHLAECKTTQTQTGIEVALTQALLQNSQARRGSLVTEKNSMLELMRLPLNICSSSGNSANLSGQESCSSSLICFQYDSHLFMSARLFSALSINQRDQEPGSGAGDENLRSPQPPFKLFMRVQWTTIKPMYVVPQRQRATRGHLDEPAWLECIHG